MITAIFLVVAFIVAIVVGFCIGINLSDGYQSKKVCRECRRTIVEWGFHSDGKEYIAVEKEG